MTVIRMVQSPLNDCNEVKMKRLRYCQNKKQSGKSRMAANSMILNRKKMNAPWNIRLFRQILELGQFISYHGGKEHEFR